MAARVGRHASRDVDKYLDGLAAWKDVSEPVEFTWQHAGRQVTAVIGKVRGWERNTIPQIRAMAFSVEEAQFKNPDNALSAYIRELKEQIRNRDKDADEKLQELTGANVRWDENL
ncbi:MAG: hypothetical protein ACKV19_29555 [Verrucomicrobiales bacterium]